MKRPSQKRSPVIYKPLLASTSVLTNEASSDSSETGYESSKSGSSSGSSGSSDSDSDSESSESRSISGYASLARRSLSPKQIAQEKRTSARPSDATEDTTGFDCPSPEFRRGSAVSISRRKDRQMTGVEKSGKKVLFFNDDMPKYFPFRNLTAHIYNGEKPASFFEQLVASFPDPKFSQCGRVRVEHLAPWLCALGVRQPHRAHYVFDNEDLEDIHTAVL